MRALKSLCFLMIILTFAACAPAATDSGGGSPTATTPIDTSTTAFGTITVAGETLTVQSVTAVALEGQLAITAALSNGAVISFAMPPEALVPGTVALGFPGRTAASAGYTTPDTQLVSDSGSITFVQNDTGFAAEFAFEAIPPVSDSAEPPRTSISGTITDIRVADETG